MIDFGLSKRFINPKSGAHIQNKFKRNSLGANHYSSLAVSQGFEYSRRDDMESLGYMLAYLLR